jgi:hypothetical protein
MLYGSALSLVDWLTLIVQPIWEPPGEELHVSTPTSSQVYASAVQQSTTQMFDMAKSGEIMHLTQLRLPWRTNTCFPLPCTDSEVERIEELSEEVEDLKVGLNAHAYYFASARVPSGVQLV